MPAQIFQQEFVAAKSTENSKFLSRKGQDMSPNNICCVVKYVQIEENEFMSTVI